MQLCHQIVSQQRKKESIHFIKSAFWIWIEPTSTAMQELIHVLVVRCALRVLQASSLKLSSLYLALQLQSVDCRSSSEANFLLSVYCTMRGEPLVNSTGFPGPLYIVRLMFLPDWTEISFYQERLKRKDSVLDGRHSRLNGYMQRLGSKICTVPGDFDFVCSKHNSK